MENSFEYICTLVFCTIATAHSAQLNPYSWAKE